MLNGGGTTQEEATVQVEATEAPVKKEASVQDTVNELNSRTLVSYDNPSIKRKLELAFDSD